MRTKEGLAKGCPELIRPHLGWAVHASGGTVDGRNPA